MVGYNRAYRWHRMGTSFGYPPCCIKAFLGGAGRQGIRKLHKSGYVPCSECNRTYSEQQLIDNINKRRHPSHPPFEAYKEE